MVSSELIGAIRRHPIWREARDQTVRALITASRDARFSPGESVLEAGGEARAIYLLLDGAVRVFYPATDKTAEITVKLFWGPAAFGEAESVMRYTWAETVQALTHARVLIADAKQYFRLMQSEPNVCFRSYWDVAQRFAVAIRAMRTASLEDMYDRLIALLISYVNHFGRPEKGCVLIDFVITQDDIARQIGSNRRSVVRTLTRLYRHDLLRRSGRRFLVPSVERLLAETKTPVTTISYKTEERPWAEVVR